MRNVRSASSPGAPSSDGVELETVACAVCRGVNASLARARPPRDHFAAELGLPRGRSSWVVCGGCGLVFQCPRPTTATIGRLYTEGAYHDARGGVPEHYIQYSLRRSRRALDWGLSRAESAQRGRALDIGCGVGGALVFLRDRGWDVVGVEPDPRLRAVASSRFGCDVRSGLLSESTFDDGTAFHFAYSCHVYEHLDDPVGTSRVAHGLLRGNGGYLLTVVPTFRRARTLAWACFSTPHMYMFTEVSLANVLDAAGFDTVDWRFDAESGDSELWLLARARPQPGPSGPFRRERLSAVQRELAVVPLRAPLGIPVRLRLHLATFMNDPKAFTERAGRRLRSQWRRVHTAVKRR